MLEQKRGLSEIQINKPLHWKCLPEFVYIDYIWMHKKTYDSQSKL